MGKTDDLDQASRSRGFTIFSTPRDDMDDWFKDWMETPKAQGHWRQGRPYRAEVATRMRLIKKVGALLRKTKR